MSLESACSVVRSAATDCIACGRCTSRCEVLADAEGRSVGQIARAFLMLSTAKGLSEMPADASFIEGVKTLPRTDPSAVRAARRCFLCDYCTQHCPVGIDARTVDAALRELLALASVTSVEDFSSTQVDKPWHIFSTYRAVYGISYGGLPSVKDARRLGADTLFFPGCPLTSYAPELTRAVFAFLEAQGIKAVITEECCGSPLRSAGLGDRARAFKEHLGVTLREAGIERIVFVCPGCKYELESDPYMGTLEFVPLTRLAEAAGLRIGEERLREVLEARGCSLQEGQTVQASVFDACYDRDGFSGGCLRALFEPGLLAEMEHSGTESLCCGAGGAVGMVDADLPTRRAQHALDEGAAAAPVMVTNCSVCSYTFALHEHKQGRSRSNVAHVNYLELLFEHGFDWSKVFYQLEGLWAGEYAAWVREKLS